MEIEIDYNPTPSNSFFVSVGLNKRDAISFDYTTKGHRIMKQVLVDHKPFPIDQRLDGEWNVLVFANYELLKTYHVKWIDMDQRDWVNDEIWEITAEAPITADSAQQILQLSRRISDVYRDGHNCHADIQALEELLTPYVNKYKKLWSNY